jgi:ubiquinone/menaquinone biosynthesis C-methylase UbiE
LKNKVGTENEAARVEWLRAALAKVNPGSRLLDAGAGEQQFRPFCSHLDYVAQDFAQYDGLGDAKGLQMGKWDQTRLDIVSDITAIPEPDASFDAILCVEVLEHLPDPLLALREFSRLLKRGGELILTAPFCSLTHFAPYHFSSGFSRYFYRTQLPACGFEITELVENGNYFEYLAQELRRIPTVSDMYVGSRPRLFEYLAIRVVLSLLERMSYRDRGSSELLHYGCLVKARRI